MKDAITITVTDHKQRRELRKLKDADNTPAMYEEAGRLWDLDNSNRDAFNQNKTITSKDIHARSNYQNKTNSNDRVIKSCKFCAKDHHIKQCPAKDKTSHKSNKMGHFASKCRFFPSISQGSWVQKLQRMPQVKVHSDSRTALPRSEPIHFMGAEGSIRVVDFGMVDGNFDNVQ